jgi:hypothetical protein
MPLSEMPVNRDRGWSFDSVDSMDDYVVLSDNRPNHPRRQPHNPPSATCTQADDGFARFKMRHLSPTHQRVTAGGRIVPMEPIPAPPQFKLLIDNLSRSKNSASEQKMADEPKVGNQSSIPAVNNTATPSLVLAEKSQTSDPIRKQHGGASQNDQMNTSAGVLKNENHMPRPFDLAHVTPSYSTGLPQTFSHFLPSFNLNSQPITHNQWGPLPSSGIVFDPYTNLLIPSGEQQPMMPPPIIPNPPFSSVSGADQMGLPMSGGDQFDHSGQQSLSSGFWPMSNPVMPFYSAGDNHLSNPGSALLNGAVTNFGPQQGNLTQQIGTHAHTGRSSQTPASDMPVNSMTMNHSSGQASNVVAKIVARKTVKITEDDVNLAEADFRHLDVRLQDHDQYTASHHSTFTPQVKSYYASERMKLVEQRHMARLKWKQFGVALDKERSAERNQVAQANHQQTPFTKDMTPAFTQKNGNANFNVQATAWVPNHLNQNDGVHTKPHSAAPHAAKSSTVDKPTGHAFTTGSQHPPFAAGGSPHATYPQTMNRNVQSVVSPTSNAMPGPYTRQLHGANGGELSEQEVDEWGVRRGCAPPELAQKQSEEAMTMMAQQFNELDARLGTASANLQANQNKVVVTDTPHPVDEWGVRIGHAPPELARKQSEQCAKLEKIHPDQRSQVSIATLDSLPSAKGTVSKTVTFVDSPGNTTYRIDNDVDDDASSVATSDETGWRPLKSGEAPTPTQAEWDDIFEAGKKPKGVKTELHLAAGLTITVEGKGTRPPLSDWDAMVEARNQVKGVKTEISLSTGDSIIIKGSAARRPRISTATGTENGNGGRKHHSVMSEEDRMGITKQLMSMEKGISGVEDGPGKPGNSGLNPWAPADENNFFRNKGPSSVAIQSVTARGTMPGVDGAVDRDGHQALKPLPKTGLQTNISPSKWGSPPKRSLKEIWGIPAPPRRAHVEAADDEEEGMVNAKKAMYKY